MSTERKVEHADGTVERINTTDAQPVIVERKSGGGMGVIAAIVGLLAVAVIAFFLFNMNQSQNMESNAVAGAAESIGAAADTVGEAAQTVVPAAD